MTTDGLRLTGGRFAAALIAIGLLAISISLISDAATRYVSHHPAGGRR